MEITIENTVKVTLELEEEEGKWLKAVMSSPFIMKNEPPFERKMRERFYNVMS